MFFHILFKEYYFVFDEIKVEKIQLFKATRLRNSKATEDSEKETRAVYSHKESV